MLKLWSNRWSASLVGCLIAAWSAAPLAQAQQKTIRITAGGARTNYVTATGIEFMTDRYFSGGQNIYHGGPIAGTKDSYLYATGRAGLYTDFEYRIPVVNGNYRLTLKFAETQYQTRGQRIFNVTVNGASVLSNFDILAEAPPLTALDKTFNVLADGGVLHIEFKGVQGYGTVSAIVVEPADGAPSLGPPTGAQPQPQPEPTPAPQPPPAPVQTPGGREWFVSPAGSSGGDGSSSNPWDLATALGHPAPVQPGDTIWLRGGTYGTGSVISSRLKGTSDKPIVVRQYPGERATINGGFATYAPYTWYWGFEVTNTNGNRADSRPECVCTYPDSTGVKLINLVLHDCSQGLGFWTGAINAEAYGNLIYYNGFQGETRGHGHGIYVQNKDGVKTISDNIIFGQFGLGVQAYGSGSAWVENIAMDGNIVFNNGAISSGAKLVDNILFAGGAGVRNITLTNNYTWHDPERNDGYSRLGWPWSEVNDNVVARDNYWIGGSSTLELWNWNNVNFTGNTIYGQDQLFLSLRLLGNQSTSRYSWDNNRYFGSGKFRFGSSNQSWGGWQGATGLDGSSSYTPGAPSGVWVFVRPNKYEKGRAHVAVYNWDQRSAVDVDLSAVLQPGMQYEVRDAQNFYGNPVTSGTYGGGAVSIPVAGLSSGPAVGNVPSPPRHTSAQFGAFIIVPK